MQSESLGFSILQILSGDLPSTASSPILQHLVVGTILSGMVQKIFPDGKALVSFNNQNVLLNSNIELQPGQNLTARVERLTPFPQLKLIPDNDLPLASGRESRPSVSHEPAPDYKTQLSSSKNISVPATFSATALERLNLVPNQEYKARVFSVMDKNNIVLELEGKQLPLVESNIPANKVPQNKVPVPGATIAVKFEKIAENLFALVRQNPITVPSPLSRETLRPYLSAYEPMPKMLVKLETAINAIIKNPELNVDSKVLADISRTVSQLRPNKETLPDAKQIRQQVQASGINYEAKLEKVLKEAIDLKQNPTLHTALKHDLKGQVLKIINSLEPLLNSPSQADTVPRNVSPLLNVFQQAVDNIELQQLSHRLAVMEQEPIVLQIPNPFSSEQVVNIYVRQLHDADKEKKKKEYKGFNLAFILNMSVLGHVKISARIQEKNLHVEIEVEKPALVKFIESRADDFSIAMKEIGFSAEMSCCLQGKVEIEFADTIHQLMIEKQTYRVDIQS